MEEPSGATGRRPSPIPDFAAEVLPLAPICPANDEAGPASRQARPLAREAASRRPRAVSPLPYFAISSSRPRAHTL